MSSFASADAPESFLLLLLQSEREKFSLLDKTEKKKIKNLWTSNVVPFFSSSFFFFFFNLANCLISLEIRFDLDLSFCGDGEKKTARSLETLKE